ncbi:hypothetical protein RZS08_06355, partial [Arthrospira platensis SPKY1]|nr:hypothetical protein [Arthrospira platensis SPKY1]
MLEEVSLLAGKIGVGQAENHLALLQGAQAGRNLGRRKGLVGGGVNRLDGAVPEGAPNHRGALQQRALQVGQPVQAGLDDAREGGGRAHPWQLGLLQAP